MNTVAGIHAVVVAAAAVAAAFAAALAVAAAKVAAAAAVLAPRRPASKGALALNVVVPRQVLRRDRHLLKNGIVFFQRKKYVVDHTQ